MKKALIFFAIFLVFTSCNRRVTDNDNDDNRAPVISSVYPSTAERGTTITVHCSAADPDSDSLSYLWTAESGGFDGSFTSQSVDWNAPMTAGTYTLTVYVSDGELSDTAYNDITVTGSTLPTSYVSGYVRAGSALMSTMTLAGVEVCIDSSCMTTNTTGFFGFSNVEYGSHILSAVKEGYISYSETLVVDAPSEVIYISLNPIGSFCDFDIEPTALDFETMTDSMAFDLYNNAESPLHWSIGFEDAWIILPVDTGSTAPSETTSITVLVDREDMEEGEYSGLLTISADACSTRYLTVTMEVIDGDSPVLYVQPSSIELSPLEGDAFIIVQNIGTGYFSWTAEGTEDWMGVSPAIDIVSTERDSITLLIDRTGLSSGTYNGEVIINTSTAGSDTVAVSMEVVSSGNFSIAPDTLNFGIDSESENMTLTNNTGSDVSWVSMASEDWISTPSGSVSSMSADIVGVEIDRDGLSTGSNIGYLFISSPTAGTDTIVVIAENIVSEYFSIYPDTLDFGNTETSLVLNLHNMTTDVHNWFITSTGDWFDISETAGTLTEMDGLAIDVTIDREALSYGIYEGFIHVDVPGLASDTIYVSALKSGATGEIFAVYPDTMDFGDSLSVKLLYLENTHTSPLTWYGASAEGWINMERTTGSIPGSSINDIDISIDRDELAPGENHGFIYIYSPGLVGDTIAVVAEE